MKEALWYDKKHNYWIVGLLSDDHGINAERIRSVHDSACPTKNGMRYKYHIKNNGSWLLAPKKSVSLTCA